MKTRKFDAVCYVVFALLAASMLVSYRYLQRDDSYIFYSYARNVIDGFGYVFNPGENVNATTSTTYTLALSVLGWLTSPGEAAALPMIGHIIGAISVFAACVFLFLIGGKGDEHLAPYALPSVFVASPLLYNSVGMEAPLALALGSAQVFFFFRGTVLTAGLLSSLGVLTRPDMILLSAVLYFFEIVRLRRLPSLCLHAVFFAPLAAWAIFSLLYFGSILPSTFAAKLGQTKTGYWGEGFIFLAGFFDARTWSTDFFRTGWLSASAAGIFYLGFLRFRAGIRIPGAVEAVCLWGILYSLAYGLILNPPGYPWYYTPFSVFLAIPVAYILSGVIREVLRIVPGYATHVHIAALAGLCVVGLATHARLSPRSYNAKYESYVATSQWLNQHAKAGDRVATVEIGIIRYYYVHGPVIDGLGLATPGVSEKVAQGDFSWHMRELEPDFLVTRMPPRELLEDMVEEPWFRERYDLAAELESDRMSVAIYRKAAE